MKKYSIFVLNKIEQKTLLRHGPHGLVERKNPGTPPSYPKTFVKCVYSDTSDRYGDDYTRRTELWEDTAGTATDEQIFAACPRLRDVKAQEIRLVGAFRLNQLAEPYQPAERDTWPTQLKEAEAFQADPEAVTPMLDAIAAGRGIEKATLVTLVMGNANLFRVKSGEILGQQQALLDRVYATQSVEELLAVKWPE